MLIRNKDPIVPSEITSESLYDERRSFLRLGAYGALGIAGSLALPGISAATTEPVGKKIEPLLKGAYSKSGEELTKWESVTSYNNFYEFGTGKEDPKENSDLLVTSPWSVTIAGEVERPGKYTLEDILKPHTMEERIYRLRCVEAWSMVIPWVGFPLADLIKQFKPNSKAKYVAFTTLADKKQMPGLRNPTIDWPYVEGLRIDEAMNPLTLMAVGLYGRELPNQNGAPLRLVVPWKYGFKSIKSIVGITFTEKEPPTTWNQLQASEYGFYANVNPAVEHPRWSQSRERRIGDFFKRPTLPFNGYADEVAGLYSGMDLKKFF